MIDGLYKLVQKNEDQAQIRLSDKNHPVFQAHFPTQAILPGFVHFEIVSKLFDIEITSIKRAKFKEAVFPDQSLSYERIKNKFKVFCEGNEVASFSL